MYKLNLKTRKRFPSLYAVSIRVLAIFLFGLLMVQVGFLALYRHRAVAIRAEAAKLDQAVNALETRRSVLTTAIGDPVALAGAAKVKLVWFAARASNPAALLSRLETQKPVGVELTSFTAVGSTGSLKVLSPNAETAARWLNAAFGNTHGRLTVEERVMGRLSILFTWND